MELSKIQIPRLENHNWVPWKYRMCTLLKGIDGLMDIVEGKIIRPVKPCNVVGESAIMAMATYNEEIKNYTKLESTALLLITNNIADETLNKIMRFSTPKEVWDELHRLYDGIGDDRVYNICLEFFAYKMDLTDDMKRMFLN